MKMRVNPNQHKLSLSFPHIKLLRFWEQPGTERLSPYNTVPLALYLNCVGSLPSFSFSLILSAEPGAFITVWNAYGRLPEQQGIWAQHHHTSVIGFENRGRLWWENGGSGWRRERSCSWWEEFYDEGCCKMWMSGLAKGLGLLWWCYVHQMSNSEIRVGG